MSGPTCSLSAERRARLEDLPPSAKLVAKTLEYEGELSQTELVDETRLPPRTVRHAVSDLEENDVVDATISFSDARKRRYSLHCDGPTEEPATEQSSP